MRIGRRGEDVSELQRTLNLKADGVFGKDTRAAVRAFQRQHGLTDDGIVGKDTRAALAWSAPDASARVSAFLSMISHAEGTDRYGKLQGYDVIVGGGLFKGFEDHPRKLVDLPHYGIKSTAAGRYQILLRYWDHYRKQLRLNDFSPACQDAVAIQMIKEQGAWDDVKAGRVREAIAKVRNIWASLPGAGYGQREVAVDKLVAFYQSKLI